ncbi:hypothetical protein PTKIN_Ptkin08bG0036800 [Pterospermum kingtungense]
MASQVNESLPLILMTLIPLLLLDKPLTITGQDIIGKALIAQTYNEMEYPEDCISTLESDPRSFISNVTGLARIDLEITASKANNSYAVVLHWLDRQHDYSNWDLAAKCHLHYNITVYSMKNSLKAFDELKYNG